MPSQTPCISLGYVDSRSRAISRMKSNKQTAEQTFLIHFYRSRRKERVGNRLGTGDWRGSMNNSYDCVNCRQRIFSFTCEAHTTALAFVSEVMGIIIFYETFSRFRWAAAKKSDLCAVTASSLRYNMWFLASCFFDEILVCATKSLPLRVTHMFCL